MPLAMTYRAEATVRPSAAVGSYACGSVSGFVMIEVSLTWSPPTCLAIDPQKSSAATTAIFVLDPVTPAGTASAFFEAVEQPAATSAGRRRQDPLSVQHGLLPLMEMMFKSWRLPPDESPGLPRLRRTQPREAGSPPGWR
jgi:hypothetical protein